MPPQRAAGPKRDSSALGARREDQLGGQVGAEANPRKPEPQARRASMPARANRVGDCHRRDMGDIEAPARSMADLGLLQPIVIRPDDRLIAGHRRLARHPLARDDGRCGKPGEFGYRGWAQSSERRRPALTLCWVGRNCYE